MVFIVRLDVVIREHVRGLVHGRCLAATIPHVLVTHLRVSLGLSGFLHLCNKWLLSIGLIRRWLIIFFTSNNLPIRWWSLLHFGFFCWYLLLSGGHLLFDTFNLQKWWFGAGLHWYLVLLLALAFNFTVQVAYYVIEIEGFLADAQRVRGCFVHF